MCMMPAMTSDSTKALLRQISEATRRRRKVLRLEAEGKTHAEIGEEMGGISRARVGQLLKRARAERAERVKKKQAGGSTARSST